MASVAELSSDLRALYSNSEEFESKIKAAQHLAVALASLDGPTAATAAIPPLVASHYVRSLLDWAAAALVKGLDKQQQQSKGKDCNAPTPVRLQPDAWALLSTVLAAPATPPTQPLPAALLPAITATLQALAGRQHKATAAAVLPQLARLLGLTAGKFANSFHPGLEHAVAAAEAALAGLAAVGERWQQEAWQPAALHAARLLHASAAAHPSPRKVFEAAVPRLLLPLARVAFSGSDGSSERSAELACECRALLTAVLFSPTHVVPLAEAMAASAAAPDAGDEAHRSYAAQLLPALARLLDDGTLPLQALPWMVGSFAAALEQHRRAERMQGSVAADAASGRSVRADGEGEDSALPPQQAAEGGGGGGGGQRGGTVAGRAGVSADFQFWAALVRLLLDRLDGGSTQLLRGLAALAACLKGQRLYRPTQDADGTQRALLQRLTDATLDAAAAAQRARGAAAAPEVGAALQVVQGVLEVEHRPVQSHLVELFPLLWADGDATGGAAGGGVQASLACSLVAAYAELRQLEVLLQALAAALLAAPAAAAPAAGALLASPVLASQLEAAAARLPSGQVPSAIRFAAASAAQLVDGGDGPRSALLLADLLGCCLGSLRVAPLPGQHAKLSAADVAPDGSSLLGGSYFAALLAGRALQAGRQEVQAGPQEVPELLPLVQAALGGGGRLAAEVLLAAGTRIKVLHQQQQYWAHLCPVELLEGGSAEAGGGTAPAARVWASGLDRRVCQQEAQAELSSLATLVVQAAAGADARALALAARAAPALQQWAPAEQLRRLLRACLRLAAAPAASREQTLALQLLRHPDLLEWAGLREALPAAAAAELHALLVALAPDGGSAGSRAKRARQEGGGGGEPASAGAAGELLEQLRRLGKGKAPKGEALRQAVASGESSLVAAAEGLDVALASAASAPGGGAGRGGKSKKRRQSAAGSGAGLAKTAAALAGAEAVLALLARQPLACLEPAAAAAVGALAACTLLLGLQACAQRLATAGAAPGMEALAGGGLGLAACCVEALAQLGQGGEGGWRDELPRAALAACAAGGSLAAAAGAAAQPSLERLQRCCQSLLADHASACLRSPERAGTLQPFVQLLGDTLRSAAGERLVSRHWAAAAAAEAVLQACQQAAAAPPAAESSHAAEIVCGPGSARASAAAPDAAALCAACQALEPAVVAAAAAARESPAGWAAPRVLGCCYGGLASLLLARCGSAPAAERLAAAGGQQGGVLGSLGGHLCTVAALLLEDVGPPLPRPAALQLLHFVAAACTVVHRTKPAASPTHLSSLAALVLHLLAALPEVPQALEPSRPTLPLSAAFPAARGASACAAARRALLAALLALVGGCDRGQLSLLLRFAEAELPVAAAGSGARALALCELALMLLEAPSGSRQQATLSQHGPRLAAALGAFVSRLACGLEQAAEPAAAAAAGGGLDTLRQLQRRILAAAAANRAADGGGAELGTKEGAEAAQWLEPRVDTPPRPGPLALPRPEQVAALCTALRAYESLAARPKLFTLPPQACIGMLQAVESAWGCFAAAASPDQSALPGFAHRLDARAGAALFCESCHLLAALLRHRAEEVRRAAPLLVQAVRALLRFLVAAELSDGLARARGKGGGAGGRGDAHCDAPAWRLKCAEGLARVMTEVAALRASTSRYCPQLLADYLILAASPSSAKARQLLGYAGPPAAALGATAQERGGKGSEGVEAVRRAEEEVLACEPLSRPVAAALRQGAYALYGACSAGEVQFLYASLGSAGARDGGGGGGPWRAALATLKADHERHFRYTGKV